MENLTGKIGSLGRVAGQSVAYAFRQLGNDRFRTILALLGVSIGVFCVTAAGSVVNSLEKSMQEGLKEFGTDAVFIEKIPIEPDLDESGEFKWWKYVSRPEPDVGDALLIEAESHLAGAVSFSVQYESGKVIGVSENWGMVIRNNLSEGREFTCNELENGAAVAIIGSSVEVTDDKSVNIGTSVASVIGKFEKSGINSVSLCDIDNAVVVPYNWTIKQGNLKIDKQTITVEPGEYVRNEAFLEELNNLMRKAHRLSVNDEADFSLNRLSFVMDEMEKLFSTLSALGWIIGLFSLIVGGFGIANVMFVSVRERTREIGLQKAIGARRSIIMFQYVVEAATLATIGGILGIIFTSVLFYIIPFETIVIKTDVRSIVSAVFVTLITGFVSGLAPAINAATLPPANAMNK